MEEALASSQRGAITQSYTQGRGNNKTNTDKYIIHSLIFAWKAFLNTWILGLSYCLRWLQNIEWSIYHYSNHWNTKLIMCFFFFAACCRRPRCIETSSERAAVYVAVKLSINGATPILSHPHLESAPQAVLSQGAARVHWFRCRSGALTARLRGSSFYAWCPPG